MLRLVVSALGLLSAAASADAVHYRLRLTEPAHQLGEVEVRLPEVSGAHLDVRLPAWRTGNYKVLNLANGVRGFSARDEAGKALPAQKIDKNTWRVRLAQPTAVNLRYEIYANQLIERVRHIDDSHAFIDASGYFMYADAFRAAPVRVDLDVPAGWASRSGLESAGAHAFTAPNYDVLIDSPIETGVHQFRRFDAGGKPHELVIWGEGNYELAGIERDLAKLAPAAERIWGGFPFERYVWMVHSGHELRGATEHLNSTVISKDRWGFAPREDYVKFIRTAAHEFVHTWNVKAYRPEGLVPYDYRGENYSRLLWVAEGTTSYFEGLLSLRAGVITPKEFFKDLGSRIERHKNRPGRLQQSVAEASFDQWIDDNGDRANNASSHIYDQGELVSLALDLEIRQRTRQKKGLEDVHRLLYQRFPASSKGYTESDLLALLREVAGSDFAGFWREHVQGVGELPLEQALAALGLELKYEADKDDKPAGQAPFTGLKTQIKDGLLKLELVQRGSPAWQAGLAAGDQLLAIDGYRVDPAKAENRLKRLKPGVVARLSVFRGDALKELVLTPTAGPAGKFVLAPKAKAGKDEKARFKAWAGVDWPKG